MPKIIGKSLTLLLIILLVLSRPEFFAAFLTVVFSSLIYLNLDLIKSKIKKIKVVETTEDEPIKIHSDGVVRRMQNLKQFRS
jgi:hypothetical protein